MSITLHLPPDIEAELMAQAQTHGLALEDYLVRYVLPEAVEKPKSPQPRKSLAQLFAESPLKGLSLKFERDPDTGRPVSL